MTAQPREVHEVGWATTVPWAVLPNVSGGGQVPGADQVPEPAPVPGETTGGDVDDDGWEPDLDQLPQTDRLRLPQTDRLRA
ncbi:hypothetical protein GCM10009779_59010 [Polymorphospora rubra]|uniref:Uncharacterized protein n=1 Tax=Polymorphospora rubra TaxID=338584 RepID=A0A810NF98_9ACTN|nr:hypothetical protein Prubr_69560 [Polymorphospora rubra]